MSDDLKWTTNTHLTLFSLDFKAILTISMVLEDLLLVLHFLTRPPYFYPSIFIFTRPNEGWTGLYIKLCLGVCVIPATNQGAPLFSVTTPGDALIAAPTLQRAPCFIWNAVIEGSSNNTPDMFVRNVPAAVSLFHFVTSLILLRLILGMCKISFLITTHTVEISQLALC